VSAAFLLATESLGHQALEGAFYPIQQGLRFSGMFVFTTAEAASKALDYVKNHACARTEPSLQLSEQGPVLQLKSIKFFRD